MFLLGVSFVAGVLSVFAACVLPLLPVIVGGSLTVGGSRRRMIAIVGSLAVSIVVFTLVLKASTVFIDVPEATWRYISGTIIVLIGVFILFPRLWIAIPGINKLNRSSNELLASGYQRGGIVGDMLMGVALGPVFASCSPTYFLILAAVLPVQPLTGFVYLVAYAAGLSLTLLLVSLAGQRIVQRLGVTLSPDGWFFRGIALVLIVVGMLVFSGTMRTIEAWFLRAGFDATRFERVLLGGDMADAQLPPQTGLLTPEMKATIYQKAPELVSPDGYLNTGGEKITIGQYRGEKVVLIDIWTYSCINCQRTLPYLTAWYDRYRDQGLEIIGVHTPEFAFEKVPENVGEAMRQWGIEYPVILDNEYRTWRAFGNQYWPRKYLIDIDGYIVYDHIGEGAYAETEAAIQRALAERAARLGISPDSAEMVSNTVVADEPGLVQSPEIYFGAWRNERLGNGLQGNEGPQTLARPVSPETNVLYLIGEWNIAREYARNVSANARILFVYNAKDVYMVASADKPVRARILLDGEVISAGRGTDVGADGIMTIEDERLYDIVDGLDYGLHILEIEILDPGLDAYTFTFG